MNNQSIVKEWTTIAYYTLDSEPYFLETSRLKKKKVVRLSKCSRNSKTDVFVDIRDFIGKRAMKNGICLKLNEFEWLMSEIRVRNRKVTFNNGQREVYIDCNSWSGQDYIIYLITPSKTSVYKLSGKELYILKKSYRNIKSDIKENNLKVNDGQVKEIEKDDEIESYCESENSKSAESESSDMELEFDDEIIYGEDTVY
jgi:hypothetical protein